MSLSLFAPAVLVRAVNRVIPRFTRGLTNAGGPITIGREDIPLPCRSAEE
jgi:hypothetical protein